MWRNSRIDSPANAAEDLRSLFSSGVTLNTTSSESFSLSVMITIYHYLDLRALKKLRRKVNNIIKAKVIDMPNATPIVNVIQSM